jgi:hypothetical protein
VDVRLAGADIIVAPLAGGDTPGTPRTPATAPGPAAPSAAVAALLSGRRSAACGERCRRRPCDGFELRAAGSLADDHGQAWLRLWSQTLVLALPDRQAGAAGAGPAATGLAGAQPAPP